MAAIDVIGYDAGATGGSQLPVHGAVLLEIGEETRLADFVAECIESSQRFGNISRLIIVAFGGETNTDSGPGNDVVGLRVFFGRDYIQLDTVAEFAPLAEKVEEILIVVMLKPDAELQIQNEDAGVEALADSFQGEGIELGRQIARTARCPVTILRPRRTRKDREAFDRFTGYDVFAGHWTTDPLQYDGQVVRFDQTGTLISEFTSSAILAASDDPRETVAL